MNWRVWYSDGNVYSSEAHSWASLPSIGIIIVVAYKETGKTVYNGGDWYWMENGEIKYISSGEWGTWKEKPITHCLSCVKQGVGVSDEEFLKIHKEAWNSKWQ